MLDALATIPVCVGYEIDGVMLDTVPSWPEELEKVKPIYEEIPGWQQPLGDMREWDQLPPQAQAYVEKIAELAGVPVKIVSVGQSREQTIMLG